MLLHLNLTVPWWKTSPLRLALLASMLAAAGCEHKKAPSPAAALPEVEVAQVTQQDIPLVREWVATMDGLVNAEVRVQVSGVLLRQNYRSGDFVRKGAPLFSIDPRPFQAAVNEAQASVGEAEGKLKQATKDTESFRAQRGKTQLDVARLRPLAAERAASGQELDNAVQADLAAAAQLASAEAAIGTAKSVIDGAKAKLDSAQLNLSYTTVTSPIDGIAGINNAQVGNLVGPASDPLTTVSTVDPILVTFTVSEQDYFAVVKRDSGKLDQAALDKLEFTLQLSDDSNYPHKGRIHAVDRQVDVKTGSILVQTAFPNPGNLLRPGGFGRVSTVAGIERGALLVPQRAIVEIQGLHLVAVVSPGDQVKLQPVTPGAVVGTMRAVTGALKPGDSIVVEGVQKIRDGMKVRPKPFVQTKAVR